MTHYTEDQKMAALLSTLDGHPNDDARQILAELPAMQAENRARYEETKNS